MADTIKREIVASIAAKCGLSKEQTLDIVQAFLDSITERLAQGDRSSFSSELPHISY